MPNTKKYPRIVRKTTTFPARTSPQAPHWITEVLAKTTGNPIAEMTIPTVRKIHSSMRALLEESRLPDNRRAITVGTGDRK